jgi:glycosyltransferase involved in cell wall biosynthesis
VLTVTAEDEAILRTALAQRQHTSGLAKVLGPAKCSSKCTCRLLTLPYTEKELAVRVASFSERSPGMLYVGFRHAVSQGAVDWLVRKVQPVFVSMRGEDSVQPARPGHLWLAGPGWRESLNSDTLLNQAVKKGRATLLGTLSEEQLARTLQQYTVMAAPIFNTASGVATKNVLAMARGIPLVTTKAGLYGLNITGNHAGMVGVADTPESFVDEVLKLHTSGKLFGQRVVNAMAHTREYNSEHNQQRILRDLFAPRIHDGQLTHDAVDQRVARRAAVKLRSRSPKE